MKRVLAAFMATTVVAACAAPVNLDAVKNFGTLATNARKESDQMAASLYQDCLVAREYGADIDKLAAPNAANGAALSSVPLVGVVPPPPTPPPPTPAPGTSVAPGTSSAPAHATVSSSTPTPSPDNSKCENDLATSQRWQAFNDGIFDYALGLAAVAGVAVAPSKDAYKTAAEGLVKIGAVQNNAVADAAGNFIADIGNAVLTHEKDHDLQDIIARSHQDNIFARVIGTAQDADVSYYGALLDDKYAVDEYFISLISAQTAELRQLATRENQMKVEMAKPAQPNVTDAQKKALTRNCGACTRHVRLAAQLFSLRERIAVERQRWSLLDQSMLVDLGRVQPYYATLTDLGRANDALISVPKPGLAGYVSALEPYVSSLGSDVYALTKALAPTPSPAPKKK